MGLITEIASFAPHQIPSHRPKTRKVRRNSDETFASRVFNDLRMPKVASRHHTEPPVVSSASNNEMKPCTDCLPTRILPWSTCHQPPTVLLSQVAGSSALHGRKMQAPSKEVIKSSVFQMLAKTRLTSGSRRAAQRKSDCPIPAPWIIPVVLEPTRSRASFDQVDGSSRFQPSRFVSRNSQSRRSRRTRSGSFATFLTTT